MKTINIILLVFLVCINLKCSRDNNVTKSDIVKINFEKYFNTKSRFNLSEIADTIEYIKLNTPKDIIITSICTIKIYDDNIFLTAKGQLYQFLLDGTFVRKIGRKGRGPGEYLAVSHFFIDTVKNEIGVSGVTALLFYSLDGTYLRQIKPLFGAIEKSDTVLWLCRIDNGINKHKLFAFNEKGDTIGGVNNTEFYLYSNFFVSSKFTNPFYQFNDSLYFKGYENNDTIWEIKDLSVKPAFVIDMGQYKLPLRYRASYSKDNFLRFASHYYSIPRVMEDDRYIFLTVTPYLNNNYSFSLIVYDKSKKDGFVAEYNGAKGIYDDILKGPAFQPMSISDDYYISCIEPDELLEQCNLDLIKNEDFKKILCDIDSCYNQLLVLCKKKI